ncbi:MAG: 50S ribosomal protein L4 [Candidatus Desulfovibrio kirbyi]|jgi:large subunit ribosomal protein L4|uniref:Large ribosomal subunit protein uL4 n=1 Tax=Candidatus Desulfovibrio kirbyi TaxID=2696086 RepID=A0A6L2R4Z8_9BACT|nr:50S ribosomal protein L4 [Desulfovibrio sp.]GFH62650.1 MAG: 50S ribosomal protein L4 [Candidatus Desulfovibrio kirbyi]
MPVVKVYDQQKRESGEVTLASDIFEVEVRPEILNFVVRAQMAAKRAGTHSTKTRAFVSGGGAKPWKQKGTGRARSGSNRSPIWRGGAVVFGPSPRDYSLKVNSKVRALALRMALSSRLASEGLLVVNVIDLPEAKTKHFARVADALGLAKALIVVPEDNTDLMRSARNIPGLSTTTPQRLSVTEILRHRQLVLLEATVNTLHARFARKGA